MPLVEWQSPDKKHLSFKYANPTNISVISDRVLHMMEMEDSLFLSEYSSQCICFLYSHAYCGKSTPMLKHRDLSTSYPPCTRCNPLPHGVNQWQNLSVLLQKSKAREGIR